MENNVSERINARYLSTISDEPNQILQPISGYASQPLLSLEEACEPLLSIVPRLKAHIWVAKQNSKTPVDGLTQDESAAIRLYTMEWDSDSENDRGSLYAHLNRTLKLVDRTKLRPWFKYLKLFLTALAKLPCEPRQTVWRGVRKNHSADYPPGAEATWWAFSSCTKSLSVLESDLYLGNAGTRTLFSIEAINGRTIRAHSHFTTEDEILLLPGTFFEVKSRLNPAPDLYIVHLQQKIPPHDLLEPPFPGAELFPAVEEHHEKRASIQKEKERPWYKRKRFLFGALITFMLSLLIILLASLLATRKSQLSASTLTTTMSLPDYNRNLSVFQPPSVGYAFYAFDSDTLDLYCRRDGRVDGGPVDFIRGFVATGKAIQLRQSPPTRILLNNTFNFTANGFTIEAFIQINNYTANASLVRFSSGIRMNADRGLLGLVLSGNAEVRTFLPLALNRWYHVAAVYIQSRMFGAIFINGQYAGQLGYVVPSATNNQNVTLVLGENFQGSIDQLAFSQTGKSPEQILWDATVAVYYPLDGHDNAWLLDYGPNVVNASSASVQPVSGKIRGAINFTTYGSLFQTPPLTPFTISNQSISIAFWIQLAQPSGVIMTVANGLDCLLVIGVRHVDQRLIVYLPNATVNGSNVILVGSKMMLNAWTHVAFTWSEDYQAQLYKDSLLDGRNPNVVQLSRPMSESLMYASIGLYRGRRECVGVDVLNTTEAFVGAMDELYIFSRELEPDEIQKLSVTTYR